MVASELHGWSSSNRDEEKGLLKLIVVCFPEYIHAEHTVATVTGISHCKEKHAERTEKH